MESTSAAGANSWLVRLYVAAGVAYLVCRALFSLSGTTLWLSIPFLGAEVLAFSLSVTFYTLSHRRREPRPRATGHAARTIDVLIATYNEDILLVRSTAIMARDMKLPHRTFICDDGRRPAMEALARELGVGYISRPDNAHYKAGNLNHALARTDGDLVAVLDADHVPRHDFLEQTVGHFDDDRVALVQVPQIYYNIDSFQHSLSQGRLWHEAITFHDLLLTGVDEKGSTPFLGTGALWRRAALKAVGGIAQGSITEDVLTSMRAHATGWTSVLVNRPIAFLLAPDTPLAYAQQRLRWAQGNLQIFRTENPLLRRGLTGWQRLTYTMLFASYLGSFAHLLFYISPAMFILGGWMPVRLDHPASLLLVVAHLFLELLVFKKLCAPHADIFHSECFRILNLPINIRASSALAFPHERPFKVTPKGKHGGLPSWILLPIVGLTLVNVAAAGIGIGATLSVFLSGKPGWAEVSLASASAWAAYLALAGLRTLHHLVVRRRTDEPFSFPVSQPTFLRSALLDTPVPAHIRRLCHELAYLTVNVSCPLELGAIVSVPLTRDASHPAMGAIAAVTRRAKDLLLKVRFDPLDLAHRDSHDRRFFNAVLPGLFGDPQPEARDPEADCSRPDYLPVRPGIR